MIISNNLRWNDYILNSEKSLLNFCYKKLRALKLMARFCNLEQRKLLANGMIISKLTFCQSVYGDASIFLKKKIQSMLTETYRVVLQDWTSSARIVHERLDFLSVDGWIQYLDYFVAKNIMDFRKPIDLAAKLLSQTLASWQQIRTENIEQFELRDKAEALIYNAQPGTVVAKRGPGGILTRAMIAGQLKYSSENSSTFHPRQQSFVPRALRTYNQVDPATRCINLGTAKWYELNDHKQALRWHCRSRQIYH